VTLLTLGYGLPDPGLQLTEVFWGRETDIIIYYLGSYGGRSLGAGRSTHDKQVLSEVPYKVRYCMLLSLGIGYGAGILNSVA
jgi:hypothetical protein